MIAPFVGSGFRPRIMLFYPEEVVIHGRDQARPPGQWIEDRLEHFFATTRSAADADAEIALSADGRILGVKDVFSTNRRLQPLQLDDPDQRQSTCSGPM